MDTMNISCRICRKEIIFGLCRLPENDSRFVRSKLCVIVLIIYRCLRSVFLYIYNIAPPMVNFKERSVVKWV